MQRFVRRNLHWIGSALALVGVAFVALRLSEYAAKIDCGRLSFTNWLFVFGLGIVYGLGGSLLALAWRNLLRQFGTTVSPATAVRIYGISQLAKYVPGNLAHIAGRQALGIAEGLVGWTLAKSAVWELGTIAAAAVPFGLLTLPLIAPTVSVALGVGGFLALVSLTIILAYRLIGPSIARAFAYYTGFLAISGVLFVALVTLVSDEYDGTHLAWLPLCGSYVVAWLCGFATPGAPAGIGVRELMLLFLLNGLMSDADLTLTVLLARIVTAAGDLLFFLIGHLIARNAMQMGGRF